MKKNLLILFTAVAVLSSCKKDSDTEKLSESYLPNAKDTQRTYVVTSGTSSYTYTETMSGVTTVLDGATYYEAISKPSNSSTTSKSYYYENDGVYRVSGTTLQAGISVNFEYLQVNTAVGATWTKNVNASGSINGVPARIVGTMKEKNISKEVLGKTYKDVIHTTIELQYNMGSGFETSATYDFYSAKGVGPISINSSIDYFGIKMSSKTELQSYSNK
jgi:hypothetical protein